MAIILESMFKSKYRIGTALSFYGHVDVTDSLYKLKDDVQKVLEYKFGDDVARKDR